MHPLLTKSLAEKFAALTLRHVEREYPNKLDHVMSAPQDVRGPRELHPVFFGSFDWHSCVHGYWQLARLIHLFPDLGARNEIIAKFTERLTAAHLQQELKYMQRPASRGFERPYGWAWLLKLEAELLDSSVAELRAIGGHLLPLADYVSDQWMSFLSKAIYPTRVGTHNSSAFALVLTQCFAVKRGNRDLDNLLTRKAREWYFEDRNCQAWEPSMEDFLSPCLVEAECMRRLLPQDEFPKWLAGFLPQLGDREPKTLFKPASVPDRTDGKIAHLDGLNFSRAWCLSNLATACDPHDPRAELLKQTADKHLEASLPHIADDYAGEHWLATFALLAMSDRH